MTFINKIAIYGKGSVLRPEYIKRDGDNVAFYCQGCNRTHSINAEDFKWNRSSSCTSFLMTIKVFTTDGLMCHSIIKNNYIKYLPDSKHDKSGQVLEMLPISRWPKY